MNDASDLGTPRGESPMPLSRKELRQRREAAAIAGASGPHVDQAADGAGQSPTPHAAGSLAVPASTEPTPTEDPTSPPGGVSFGSLAGMFAAPAEESSPRPTVLTVCTGNICRSPLAESLLRTRLAELDLRVHSAGTHGMVGHAMTDPAQKLAHDRGVDAGVTAAHRARLLTEPLLDDADLVLTMTSEQRDYAVQMLPRRLHRVFPVREFARLAQGVTDAQVRTIADRAGSDPRRRLVAVVETISDRRGGSAPKDEDVIDPYRRSTEVYEESAAQLTPALAEVERVIRAALA
ncbi:hypothetical protein [Microbacterium sp. Au-Mic1]|uniref:arsenate reductase/protein-tyrosine-phosphatase family protein n=1 Tax=Microbacterium sp. Au-Mic1 TaxID=2906457 RepID=UPI0027DEC626|nr:hypothetical protein [Microbacterium sp. Au-Mic1]